MSLFIYGKQHPLRLIYFGHSRHVPVVILPGEWDSARLGNITATKGS